METPAWMESNSAKPSQRLLNGNAELRPIGKFQICDLSFEIDDQQSVETRRLPPNLIFRMLPRNENGEGIVQTTNC